MYALTKTQLPAFVWIVIAAKPRKGSSAPLSRAASLTWSKPVVASPLFAATISPPLVPPALFPVARAAMCVHFQPSLSRSLLAFGSLASETCVSHSPTMPKLLSL